MSLTDKVNSVQGIALSALQATANIKAYLSTFVAPDIGGIPAASLNHTWSSLVNTTIPTLLPTSRFNTTIGNHLTKSEASSTYARNSNITTMTISVNDTLNNILNNNITVCSDINHIKATLPSLLNTQTLLVVSTIF